MEPVGTLYLLALRLLGGSNTIAALYTYCLPLLLRWLRQLLPSVLLHAGFSEWPKSVLATGGAECGQPIFRVPQHPRVGPGITTGTHILYGIPKLALFTRDVSFPTSTVVSPAFGLCYFS